MNSHSRWGRLQILLTVTAMAAAPAAMADVILVDDDAPAGGDGLSWETAHRFLRDALGRAAAGDEIRVAGGHYRPDRDEDHPDGTGDRTVRFEVTAGLSLRGGYLGLDAGEGENPDDRDFDRAPAVLSGDLLGDRRA